MDKPLNPNDKLDHRNWPLIPRDPWCRTFDGQVLYKPSALYKEASDGPPLNRREQDLPR